MFISDMQTGETRTVVKLNNGPKVKRRLYNIGLTEGIKVTLIRRAPTADPLEIKVRDFYLAIRRSEAANIEVK